MATLVSSAVLEGKDGFLFLQNDSNRTMDQIRGNYVLPLNFKNSWLNLFRHRRELCDEAGAKYLYAMAPGKECVYREKLPDGIIVSDDRPSCLVLQAADNIVQTCYPLDELVRLSKTRRTYSKGDTHWDMPGAYLMYREMMKSIGINYLLEDRLKYFDIEAPGDLSSKIGRTTERSVAHILGSTAVKREDNGITGVGHLVRWENSIQAPSCVIFRDSFGNFLVDLLSETFSKVTLVWQPNIDQEIVRRERPNIVISLQAERFVVSIPKDNESLTHADYVEAKKSGILSLRLGSQQ